MYSVRLGVLEITPRINTFFIMKPFVLVPLLPILLLVPVVISVRPSGRHNRQRGGGSRDQRTMESQPGPLETDTGYIQRHIVLPAEQANRHRNEENHHQSVSQNRHVNGDQNFRHESDEVRHRLPGDSRPGQSQNRRNREEQSHRDASHRGRQVRHPQPTDLDSTFIVEETGRSDSRRRQQNPEVDAPSLYEDQRGYVGSSRDAENPGRQPNSPNDESGQVYNNGEPFALGEGDEPWDVDDTGDAWSVNRQIPYNWKNLSNETQYSLYRNNCSHCRLRERWKEMRLQQIRDQILSKLRMKAPPNVTKPLLPPVPKIMSRMISRGQQNIQNDHSYEYDDYHVNTMSVLVTAVPHPQAEELMLNSSNSFYFNFKPEVARSRIIRARLYIYALPSPTNRSHAHLTLSVVQPSRRPGSPAGYVNFRDPRRVRLNNRKGKWFSWDVTSLVERWIKRPDENVGLRIVIVDNDGNHVAVVHPGEGRTQYKPFLEMAVEEQGQSRSKRRSEGLRCHEMSLEERCCLYPLVVDFEQFGWDWIINPKRYHANYCSGECPFVFMQKYPHTHIVQQNQEREIEGGPCCNPRKMSPISMLFYDEYENFVYGTLPGMVVEQCGCS